eukprot:6484225-Amphidinium_carterae.2
MLRWSSRQLRLGMVSGDACGVNQVGGVNDSCLAEVVVAAAARSGCGVSVVAAAVAAGPFYVLPRTGC